MTVALSGEGGDELFFGYGAHQWARRLQYPIVRKAGRMIAPVLERGSSRRRRIAHLLQNAGLQGSMLHDHIFSQEQYLFSLSELTDLLTDQAHQPFSGNDVRALKILDDISQSNNRKLSAMEQQALFDIVTLSSGRSVDEG
jgi:asparagine synthase (glutamine-hydrolysing)